jgi:hypothetical protein
LLVHESGGNLRPTNIHTNHVARHNPNFHNANRGGDELFDREVGIS